MDRPNATLIQLRTLRFHFEACEQIHFPPGKSANILRGAFGTIFRRSACVPECHSAATCPVRATCAYAKLFEPSGPSPSGLADWPRPFVFRANHLDGITISPAGHFHFDLNLFELTTPVEEYFTLTFAQLAREGLGAGRKKVELLNVQSSAVSVSLVPPPQAQTELTIQFLTPTELKTDSHLASKPEFPILAARIRDRISTLCHLYGDGAPALDYKAFASRAALIQMTSCNIHQVKIERKSTKTNQVHGIGGFVGEARYQGPLTEFLPWLEAAYYTGVGRQTVWGKGQIQTKLVPAHSNTIS